MRFVRQLVAIVTFAVPCLASLNAMAQAWPSKPIRIVVPFPAGGSVDSLARVYAARMQEQLRQSVVIDNRGGAGGNLGAGVVAKSTPDGYTLLLNINGQAISPAIYKTLSYDADNDLVRVTQLVATSTVLVVNPKVPAKNLQEFIGLAKARPGALNYGSTGVGNALHLTMEMLKLETGMDIQMVPFTGDAPLFNTLIAGDIQAALVPTTTAKAHVAAGNLRAIAMTTAQRVPSWPDTPTIAEQGYPKFAISGWIGLFAPAGTPTAIVERIAVESKIALGSPELQQALKNLTLEPVGSTPTEFEALYRADRARFQKIIKDANIPLQE